VSEEAMSHSTARTSVAARAGSVCVGQAFDDGLIVYVRMTVGLRLCRRKRVLCEDWLLAALLR